jgi:hypothetical protein
VFERMPELEKVEGDFDWRNRPRKAANAVPASAGATIRASSFGALGFAQSAIASYAEFKALRASGIVKPGVRFMVALPSPYNVISWGIAQESRVAVEIAYEARVLEELTEICAAIPHSDLSIQWDCAHDMQADARLVHSGEGRHRRSPGAPRQPGACGRRRLTPLLRQLRRTALRRTEGRRRDGRTHQRADGGHHPAGAVHAHAGAGGARRRHLLRAAQAEARPRPSCILASCDTDGVEGTLRRTAPAKRHVKISASPPNAVSAGVRGFGAGPGRAAREHVDRQRLLSIRTPVAKRA